MENLKLSSTWMTKLLPEGVLIPSSTIISGPGGSGKPLIGNFITADWLRQGGSVVFMSLQYPDHSFITASIKRITGLEIAEYEEKIAFIELDALLEGMENPTGRHFKANVAIPEVWEDSLERACGMVPAQGPGILVFGSALNLLLFSRTYGDAILEKMKSTIQDTSGRSYLFSTSTTAKADAIAEIEEAADNLLMVRRDPKMKKLFMKIERMKGVKYLQEEIEVPFSQQDIEELKIIADQSRKRVIPLISKL